MARDKEIKQLELKNGQIEKFVSLEDIGVDEHDLMSPIAPSYEAFNSVLSILGINIRECPHQYTAEDVYYVGAVAAYDNKFYRCIKEYQGIQGQYLEPAIDITHWKKIEKGDYLAPVLSEINHTQLDILNRFDNNKVLKMEVVTQMPASPVDNVLYILIEP